MASWAETNRTPLSLHEIFTGLSSPWRGRGGDTPAATGPIRGLTVRRAPRSDFKRTFPGNTTGHGRTSRQEERDRGQEGQR